MFNFFHKKPNIKNTFEFLGTDLHSHLVPGVDDGADTNDTAIHLLESLDAMGFSKFIITPHIYKDYFDNSLYTLKPPFENFKNISSNTNIYLSAEYYLDENFENSLAKHDLIPFPKKQVLIETSFIALDLKLEEYVFGLVSKGYKPILAHPERYLYMAHDKAAVLKKLKTIDCKLQINLNSFAGLYGSKVKDFAFWLIDNIEIDYLGTDLHHVRQLDTLQSLAKSNTTIKKLRSYQWKNIELLD